MHLHFEKHLLWTRQSVPLAKRAMGIPWKTYLHILPNLSPVLDIFIVNLTCFMSVIHYLVMLYFSFLSFNRFSKDRQKALEYTWSYYLWFHVTMRFYPFYLLVVIFSPCSFAFHLILLWFIMYPFWSLSFILLLVSITFPWFPATSSSCILFVLSILHYFHLLKNQAFVQLLILMRIMLVLKILKCVESEYYN